MKLIFVFLSLGFLFFQFDPLKAKSVPVRVKTLAGILEGVYLEESNLTQFLGIPYAIPPVGPLRWTDPQPFPSWSGVRPAVQYGAICEQNSNYSPPSNNHSEDCLFLNVYIPGKFDPAATWPMQNSLSTMVWIHGGSFISGASSQRVFWGDFFANSSDTILVSINYRLGALGFLYNPEIGITGNYGIKDQAMALTWVSKNIQFFGGSSTNVTLFGESAGAMSVTIHLVSPMTFQAKYFHRAIVESNPVAIKYRTGDEMLLHTDTFALWVECLPGDKKCFWNLNVSTILAAQSRTIDPPLRPSLILDALPWEPVLDALVLPDQPLKLIQQGKYYKVPTIFGTNKNETAPFGFDLLRALGLSSDIPRVVYEGLVSLFFQDHARQVLRMYPAEENSLLPSLRLTADYLFICPTRNISLQLANDGLTTFSYHFLYHSYHNPTQSYPPECTVLPGIVCHAAELPYVFHSEDFYTNYTFSADEKNLSWTMLRAWAQFAAGAIEPIPKIWKPFEKNTLRYMGFDVPALPGRAYNAKVCDMWDSIGYDW